MLTLALMTASIGVSSWKWQLLLRAQGQIVRWWWLMRLYLIGVFFSNLLPSTIGGDVARVGLARRLGGGTVVASVVVERVTGMLVLSLLVVAALSFGPTVKMFGNLRWIAVATVLAGGTMLAISLWRAHATLDTFLASRVWIDRLARMARLHRMLSVTSALQRYSRSGMALVVSFEISALFYAILIMSQFSAIRALHGQIELHEVALVAPLVIFVSAVPIAINGLGVTEAAFVLLYAQVGLTPEVALASAILRRVLLVGISLAGAGFWLAGRQEDSVSETPEAAKPEEGPIPRAWPLQPFELGHAPEPARRRLASR